jgi:hypothetical protein
MLEAWCRLALVYMLQFAGSRKVIGTSSDQPCPGKFRILVAKVNNASNIDVDSSLKGRSLKKQGMHDPCTMNRPNPHFLSPHFSRI